MRGIRSGARGGVGGGKTASADSGGLADSDGRASDVGPDHPAARCIHAWVGMDTVGTLLRDTLDEVLGDGGIATRAESSGSPRDPSSTRPPPPYEVDVLSIDMDGVDLYMLQPSLEAVNPRVLVVGYQDIIGPVRSLTVPPVKSGVRYIPSRGSGFAGASLTAFVRVLARWEYHFVGCEAAGYVGFFSPRRRHSGGAPRRPRVRARHHARGQRMFRRAKDARGDGEAMARGSRRSVGARGRRLAEKVRAGTAAEKRRRGPGRRTPGRGTVTTREDADTIPSTSS